MGPFPCFLNGSQTIMNPSLRQSHSFHFNLDQRKLASAYHSTSLNWGILQNVDEFGQRSPDTDRIDLGYKIEKPIVINRGITLTPSWDIRQRKTQHGMTDFDHTVGGFGADLDFSFHRKFRPQF